MKIPKNIDTKLKAVCGTNEKAYNTLKDLIEYEGNNKSKQNINCKETVEKYIAEVRKDEN